MLSLIQVEFKTVFIFSYGLKLRRWDDNILLKEDVEASCISKKEATLKREKVKQCSGILQIRMNQNCHSS